MLLNAVISDVKPFRPESLVKSKAQSSKGIYSEPWHSMGESPLFLLILTLSHPYLFPIHSFQIYNFKSILFLDGLIQILV